jgi:hypothetical protein
MPINVVGGGYQIDDGNLNEIRLIPTPVPQAVTGTTTTNLTVANITGDIIQAAPTNACAYVLPTVAALETALGLPIKVGAAFELIVTNTVAFVITMTTNTGWTLVGLMTVASSAGVGSAVTFLARKTGDGTWTLYRTAG